jgi:diguanylate cyclase (GGDEF)-like protein
MALPQQYSDQTQPTASALLSLETGIARAWKAMAFMALVGGVYGLVGEGSLFSQSAAPLLAVGGLVLAMSVMVAHLFFVQRRAALNLQLDRSKLESLRRQHDALMANDSVGIAVTEGLVLCSTNRRFAHLLGVQVDGGSKATALAAILRGLGLDPDPQRMQRLMLRLTARVQRKGVVIVNLAYQVDRCQPSWLRLEVRCADSTGAADRLLWMIADGTASKNASDQMSFLAQHDALTGLANRRQLLVRARRVLETQTTPLDMAGIDLPPKSNLERPLDRLRRDGVVAVLSIDLDDFKAVNETHGFSIGDEVLTVLARRLAHGVRSGDLVARIDGDQFAVLLRQVKDRPEAALVAEKLRDLLSSPVELNDCEVQVGANIGLSIGPEDGATIETLLAHADRHRNASKKALRRHFIDDQQVQG